MLGLAMRALPPITYLYYADSAHLPYGTKSSAEITQLVAHACDFLATQKIKALVVACNTATAAAIHFLRPRFPFPIIGMEPAIKPAGIASNDKKILLLATSLTLREKKLTNLIMDLGLEQRVVRLALDQLVPLAERFEFTSPAVTTYLQAQFQGIDWSQYDSVVLGCTHFSFFKTTLRQLLGAEIAILDGTAGTVKRLAQLLNIPFTFTTTLRTLPAIEFFASGKPMSPEYVHQLHHLLLELPGS